MDSASQQQSRSGNGRDPALCPGVCLVFGASGYIGSHLVPRLLDEGIPVRTPRRISTR
jgi:hypothetical protein